MQLEHSLKPLRYLPSRRFQGSLLSSIIGEIAVGSQDKGLYLALLQRQLVTELIETSSVESINWQALKAVRDGSPSLSQQNPLSSAKVWHQGSETNRGFSTVRLQNLIITQANKEETAFSSFCSSFLPIITLPLFLFYHDSRHQLKMQLVSLLKAWLLPQDRLPGLLFWGQLITLILREKQLSKHLFGQLSSQKNDFSKLLTAVKTVCY